MDEPLLELSIPYLPPSVNTHYVFCIQGGKIRVKLSDPADKWKKDAKLFMKPCKQLRDDWLYRVEIALVGVWLDKTGLPIRKDCRNHGKLVVDALFERYGLNDKLVWDDRVVKVHDSKEERVEVRLWRYNDKSGRLDDLAPSSWVAGTKVLGDKGEHNENN